MFRQGGTQDEGIIHCLLSYSFTDPTDLPQRPAPWQFRHHSSSLQTHYHLQSLLSILPFTVLRSAHPTSAPHSLVLNPMLLLPFSSQIPSLAKPAAKEEPISILPPFPRPLPVLRLLLRWPCVSPSLPIPVSEITIRISILVFKSDHSRRLIIRKRARHHHLAPPRPCCRHPVEPMYLSVWRQMAASNRCELSPHKDSVFAPHHNAFW